MPGILRQGFVVVPDQAEASQIHNKGYFGEPQSGGAVRLDLLEAVLLVEAGRISVIHEDGTPATHLELLREGHLQSEDFEVRLAVYREMRLRGYVVKAGAPPSDFVVYPRGGGPKKTPVDAWLMAISEQREFSFAEMSAVLDVAEGAKKKLMLCLVDEEGDVTHYECERVAPQGHVRAVPSERQASGWLLRDRVVVEKREDIAALRREEYFGKLVAESLHLPLIEACYLAERGDLEVTSATTGKTMKPAALVRKARVSQPDFSLRYTVYRDLKEKGVLAKTGFKYGSHFRAYKGDPDSTHAKFLVHAVGGEYTASWPELSRIVRLAHGVKKEIMLARVHGGGVEYVRLMRVRP